MHQLKLYIFWLLLFVCLPGITPCHAKDGAISEQGYLQEFPVVLSASRLSQPLSETPNAVTVIDRAMIHASGFRTIADLFRLVPGMYVDYQDGYTPIVSYHGATDIYTRRMQILVDGRSVYLQPFNTVDWEDLPLHIDDIERIEVVRGPAATSYGSNSILGVINITTLGASALHGANISAAKGNAGNAGISDAAAHFGRSGEQLDYRLAFGLRSDNGFNFPTNVCPGPPGCQPTYYNISNDSSTTRFASLRGDYHPGGTDSFDFQLGYSNGVRSAGYNGLPVRPLSPLRNIKNDSWHQQVTWLRTLNDGDDIQLRYYHISRSTIDERVTLTDTVITLPHFISDNVSADRHEFELQHTMHMGQNNRLVWGAASRRESVDASSLFSTSQALQQSRLFMHDELRASPQLILNAGAMLETDGLGHNNVSPRVAINYHFTPEQTLRVGASVAYRNPALTEERGSQHYYLPEPAKGGNWVKGLYQELLSSGGLRPERALSREIGYLGQFANGLSVDVRAYNDYVSDIIWVDYTLAPGSLKEKNGFPVAWDFRNEFAANYTGLEGSVKYSWGGARSSLAFSFSHQKVGCDPVGSPYLAAHPILGPVASSWYASMVQAYINTVPLNSGSLLYIRQMDDGMSFSAAYHQQGSVMVLDANSPQPLNRRVDMRISKQFGPAGERLKKIGGGEVALVVQNVFQDNNVGYSGYLFDRRAYLTATINF